MSENKESGVPAVVTNDRTKTGPTPKRSVRRAARSRGLPPMPPLLVNRPVHGEKPQAR
jgi:hypothetical protein